MRRGCGLLVCLLLLAGCSRISVDQRDGHGMTQLMYAAKAGDIARADQLIRRGADVNAKVPTRDLREFIAFISWMQELPKSDIGYTPLMYAAAGRKPQMLSFLSGKGAHINETSRTGESALDLAVFSDDVEVIRPLTDAGVRIGGRHLAMAIGRGSPETLAFLLGRGGDPNEPPARPLATNPPPNPLLISAVRTGRIEMVKLLLDAGAKADVRDSHGWSALRWAKHDKHDEIVALLEAAGVQDDGAADAALLKAIQAGDSFGVEEALRNHANANGLDDRGVPMLHHAAQVGDAATVKALLAAGANVKAATQYDATALILAARAGHTEIVRFLLDAGSVIGYADPVYNDALSQAIDFQHEDTAVLLLERGADPNKGALALAALRRNQNLVILLLDHGADPKRDSLHILSEAARGGDDEIVVLLLDRGAEARARGEDGQTALHRAASNCSPTAMKALLDHGADVNARELNGYTPLLHATVAGKKENVAVLLAAGADPNAKDDNGKTVLQYAARYPEIEDLLRNAGAR